MSTWAASSSARTPARAPFRRPIGVRTASTISASVMVVTVPPPRATTAPATRPAFGRRGPSACRRGRGRAAAREAVPAARTSATRASSRARCIPRQTCGPCAKAAWSLAFSRSGTNRCGSTKTDGSRFAAESETRTSSRRPIVAPPSSTSRVAYRSTTAAAGSSRSDSSTTFAASAGRSASSAGCEVARQDVPEHVRDHPVGRLDPSEEQDGRVRDDLAAVERARSARRRAQQRRGRLPVAAPAPGRCPSASNASAPSGDGSRPAVMSVTAPTMAPYQARGTSAGRSSSPSARRHRGDRERPAELRSKIGRPPCGDPLEQALALGLDELREPLVHRPQTEGARERRPMSLVLRAVERQHARPDDLRRREARVVDGEGLRVAHHGEREVASRHEPPVERRQP